MPRTYSTASDDMDSSAFWYSFMSAASFGPIIAEPISTKAIAAGLGVTDVITSPTFNIVKQYDSGRLPLYHFDVYRIGDVDEMYEIGYEEYFFGDGVCVIEWADLIEEIIPDDAVRIEIEYGEKEGERIYRCMF